MTLLETVLAVVLLSLITASMAGVAAYITGSLERQRIRLAAAEVAHSLLIQYVDNKNEMPPETLPIGYGDYSFRWSISVEPVMIEESATAQAIEADSANSNAMRLDRRMKIVSVTAWLGEASGGSLRLTEGVPTVQMARLFDTFGFKNPDGTVRYLEGEGGLAQLLEDVMDASGTQLEPGDTRAPGTGGQSGNRSGSRGGRPSDDGGGARP